MTGGRRSRDLPLQDAGPRHETAALKRKNFGFSDGMTGAGSVPAAIAGGNRPGRKLPRLQIDVLRGPIRHG